ncbi:MAG TPA: peptidylprolyl isomerase [Saprospiraceae bacterium]|nr:peptidylprolyl isomerase [Saprospiraceae bacterium]
MNRIFIFVLILCSIWLYSCSKNMLQIVADQKQIQLSQKVKLSPSIQDAENYEWDFGDGEKSTSKFPEHRFLKSGTRTVTLKTTKANKTKISKMDIQVQATTDCLVELQTPMGNMLIKLYDETPHHRDNFIKLAEQHYYDDLLFHRVINGFMIQGGDPDSKNAVAGKNLGSGGPGYTVDAEFNPKFIHKKGALAAARTGDQINPQKKSSGSQFYIVQGTKQSEAALSRMEDQKGIKYSEAQKKAYMEMGGTPFLDMEYTVYGEVIDGLDVIDKIAATKTQRGDRPEQDVKMKMVVLK